LGESAVVSAGISHGGAGLIQLLAHLVGYLERGRRKEAKSLKRLADKKFSQIDKTHHLFVQLVQKLHDTTGVALERLRRTNKASSIIKELDKTLGAIRSVREKSADRRREQYEEAKVYSENVLSSMDFFVKIPPEVAGQLGTFMASFCTYFEMEGVYSHELGSALNYAASIVARHTANAKKKSDRLLNDNLGNDLSDIFMRTRSAYVLLRSGWANVARAYHELNLRFRDMGLE